MPLSEQYELYLATHPGQPARETAAALGVSEAELVMTALENNVVLLTPDIKGILEAACELGYVTLQTQNKDCIYELKGFYNPSVYHQLCIDRWHIAIAVDDIDNRCTGLEFYSEAGMALHKILLTRQSNRQAYESLVSRFRNATQQTIPIKRAPADINVVRYKETGQLVQEMDIGDFKRLMAFCAGNNIPLLMLAGNEGCQQQYIGTVKNLVGMGAWYQVNDDEFVLHLREAAAERTQYVVRHSAEGDTHWLTLLNQQGDCILQVCGCPEAGMGAPTTWLDALSTLPA